MTVNELVTSAMVVYMQGGKEQGLEYVSKSECAQLGWYFWLREAAGVYEMEMKGFDPEANKQGAGKEEFHVRYYPALDEEVLEDFSVQEQLLRFDHTVFDDGEITTDLEEHEICPCCGVPHKSEACIPKEERELREAGTVHHEHMHGHDHIHHEHCSCGCGHEQETGRRRSKGIPGLLKKFDMNKKLFKIGDLEITAEKTTGNFTAVLKTRERLTERAEEPVMVQQDGNIVELVEKGGINRNVPGRVLAERFMDFFGGRVLATMAADRKISKMVTEDPEPASGSYPNPDKASDISIQYIFK